MEYAGIGSRRLSLTELTACSAVGEVLAELGWTLRTGACTGADQAFAAGALRVGGQVTLCLPWASYEAPWVGQAQKLGAQVLVLGPEHKAARESVRLHPAADRLSSGARALHARNFLIIEGSSLVYAWPKPNQWGLGGTGQGLLIAERLGIEVVRMDKVGL